VGGGGVGSPSSCLTLYACAGLVPSGPGKPTVAPNNGFTKYHCDLTGNCYKGPAINAKQIQCAQQALAKNGVALALDVAGVGAGFLPGGDLVVEGAQIGVGAASTVNSAIGGDLGGSLTSIFGIRSEMGGRRGEGGAGSRIGR
jgi:hypothetical protein